MRFGAIVGVETLPFFLFSDQIGMILLVLRCFQITRLLLVTFYDLGGHYFVRQLFGPPIKSFKTCHQHQHIKVCLLESLSIGGIFL